MSNNQTYFIAWHPEMEDYVSRPRLTANLVKNDLRQIYEDKYIESLEIRQVRIVEVGKVGDFSDGYHTFNELYDHRCLLWINLILQPAIAPTTCWVKEHYEGWDLLVHTDYSKQTQYQPYIHPQISYHVPKKFRHLYEGRITETESHDFDGHTSKDVLVRLESLATPTSGEGEK